MSLAEVLPTVQQLSRRDKVKLARILLDDVDTEEDNLPLEANKSYYIATPYGMYGVAGKLIKTLEQDYPLGVVAL